jgi:hypothetical protein
MVHYFGFGSNMSLASLRAKGVVPQASWPAVLAGWRLRFNVEHFFRHEGGMGNVEYTGSRHHRVLGVLHRCTSDALPLLDAAEACGYGYARVPVDVEILPPSAEHGRKVAALTYVGLPPFLAEHCLPTRRYLNILVAGARQAGLDPAYIDMLQDHPTHPAPAYPPFRPPPGRHPRFDAAALAAQPLYTALCDAVFDMSAARPRHEYLKGYFGGRDTTLFHLRRLDTSNGSESADDIHHSRMNEGQRHYLNAYLHEYNAEYRYVGRFIHHQD